MAIRIPEFDLAQEGYAGASVAVYEANTTTLADIYGDEAGTAPLANPQTLQTVTIGSRTYGQWTQAVYVAVPYQLSINTSEQTGVERIPLTTLNGVDASKALAKAAGAVVSREIEDHLAQEFWVEDFGVLDSDAANNTTIITAALGAASSAGGGEVLLPEGTIPFNTLTIPLGVNLKGRGRTITTIQSTQGAEIITFAGARSEISRLTLDGISKQANSVGVHIENISQPRLTDVEIKRFEVGVFANGMSYATWTLLQVSDCDAPVHIHGEVSTGGAESLGNAWQGGGIDGGIDAGIEFHYHDVAVGFMALRDLKISNCVGDAILIEGGRNIEFDNCQFLDNTDVIEIRDGSPETLSNTSRGIKFRNCLIDGGDIDLEDSCEDVVFEECDFRGNAITLTTVKHNVKLLNCVEDSSVTISGDGTKLIRDSDSLSGTTKGVTTGNVATKAWSIKLQPGEMCAGIAHVTGKARNGTDKANYSLVFGAQRAVSTLAYDAQTANFTVGALLTGATSGATARIVADADAGVTGTLSLHTITGAFIDNEIITDSVTGSATANGALVAGSVAILSQASLTSSETDASWACVAAGTVEELEIQVTGNTGDTVDWTVKVNATRETA
jgi:hypothetical protein